MTQTDFAGLEATVERRLLAGQPLERVEEFIESQPLDDDTKAALWLVAWSMEHEPRAGRLSRRLDSAIDTVYD